MPGGHERNERLAAIAARQNAQVRTDQALAVGHTKASIATLLESATWISPHKNVMRLAGSTRCPEQELLGVCLAHGNDALIGGPSACWLWDMPGPHLWGPPIHVLCPDNSKVRLDGVRTHRSRLLVPADVSTHRDVPVVSYARAIVDSTGRADLSNRQLGFMVDHGVRNNHLEIDALHHAVARLAAPARGRSLRRMRLLLADRPPGYDPGASQPEARVARWLEGAGYGRPTMNAKVRAGGVSWEVDVSFLWLRLGWEYQSERYHGEASVKARKRDAEKRAALEGVGWLLDEVTDKDTEATFIERASAMIAAAKARIAQSGRDIRP